MGIIRILILVLISYNALGQTYPNIILILADDLGAGEVNFTRDFYGLSAGNYETATPTIDSLARNGAYFSRFYVQPICSPTRHRLMTGTAGFRYEGNWDYAVESPFDANPIGMKSNEKTIAEYLKERGYQTAFFGKWNLGSILPENMPHAQGFDYWYGSVIGFTSQKEYQVWDIHTLAENGNRATAWGQFESAATNQKVIDWIEAQAQDATTPFFLYYAFTNPHNHNETVHSGGDTIPYIQSVYDAAPPGLTASQKQKWASIKDMDNRVASVWEKLRELGIEENTVIFFTSDNGGDPNNNPDHAHFSGQKAQALEGGVRMPAIWYHSGAVDSMTIDSVCAIEDLLPTFYEGICGGNVRDTIDGVNFYPLLGGSGSYPANRVWYGPYIPNRMWSVVKGQWKLINNPTASASSMAALPNNIALYDLANDAGETTDVSGSNPSVVTELQALIDAITPTTPRAGLSYIKPVGWVDQRWWGDPVFWYNPSYYWYSDVPKYED